jgi:predicted ArsR family transcriptional regulator
MTKTQRQAATTSPAKTKKDRILSLLKRKSGASIEQIGKETGWQPHTVRAALTRLRQAGFPIERSRDGEVSRYRVIKDRVST